MRTRLAAASAAALALATGMAGSAYADGTGVAGADNFASAERGKDTPDGKEWNIVGDDGHKYGEISWDDQANILYISDVMLDGGSSDLVVLLEGGAVKEHVYGDDSYIFLGELENEEEVAWFARGWDDGESRGGTGWKVVVE